MMLKDNTHWSLLHIVDYKCALSIEYSIHMPPSKGLEIPQLEQYGSQQRILCNSCHSIYQLQASDS